MDKPSEALPAYFFCDTDGVIHHCLPEIRYVTLFGYRGRRA